jgi:hypothetical protein
MSRLIGMMPHKCPFCSKESESGYYDDDSGCLHVVCDCKNHYLVKLGSKHKKCKNCEGRLSCLGLPIIISRLIKD